ncbi:YcnI family protein [Terrarubrum flagellatum]|uniref:YcnI family copper-binding membrane protein n=1 Tax=Terrirubrum flagellatum TaxID=2895980 RepID=UPI00314545CC
MLRSLSWAGSLAALITAVGPLQAHVTLENKEAAAGASFRLVLRVPHGCAGAATTRIRVQIPKAFASAKPQPKPGWTYEVIAQKAVEHTGSAGHDHGSAPQEISWSGRLEDGAYDEFALWVSIAKNQAAGPVYVPIVQECDGATERWIEIPGQGARPGDLKSPAPSFKLLAPT